MDKNLGGRAERDARLQKQIEEKLDGLPGVFTEYYMDMLCNDKSVLTIKQYVYRIIGFAEYFFDNEIPDDFYEEIRISDIKKYLSGTNGKDTAALTCSALKSFYEFLVVEREFEDNPMIHIRRPNTNKEHAVTYLSEEEIQTVFKAIQSSSKKCNLNRDRAIVSLFLATGLRCSALRQINLSDIDTAHRIIRVIEKGSKIRNIPYGEGMVSVLQDWLDDRQKYYPDIETDALFVTERKERISHSFVNRLIEKYTKGIDKHITSHKLRSTAATTLAAQGTSVQTIKEVLGHNNVQTTMRYIAAVQKEKDQAVHTLDTLVANYERSKTG